MLLANHQDTVKNDEIWKQIGLKKLEDIITERRLRWLRQVLHMLETRIPYRIICCEFE